MSSLRLLFWNYKIDRINFLNCPSNFTANSSAAKIFTATTNIILIQGLFTPGRDGTKHFVKTGISLVSGKLKIIKWMVIQTDASKSGLSTQETVRKAEEFAHKYSKNNRSKVYIILSTAAMGKIFCSLLVWSQRTS